MKHLSLLSILFFFLVFSPVLGGHAVRRSPEVKAIYTQEPKIPNLKEGARQPEFTATSIFAIDIDSGVVVFNKNPHQRLKPASLTKIMTALVAMDYYPEDSILKIYNGQKSLGNTIDLQKDDQLLAKDLLYGLLVSSGNDAAITFAENYPGGYKAFVEKMNIKVDELGLKDTHFVNVSGVESPNHYTTAYDITMIARSALERSFFSEVVSTKKITLKSLKGNLYPLVSTNVLLSKPGFYGVKTGWTPEAGECLVILAENESHRIIIGLLHSQDRFGEGEAIANWIFSNYLWE